MSTKENRNIVIQRVKKEIIGPGSDIFLAQDDFNDEIIEGKPLHRYFSAILFPKQLRPSPDENGANDMIDEDEEDPTDFSNDEVPEKGQKELFKEGTNENDNTDTLSKYK